jgi:hypothetical protein
VNNPNANAIPLWEIVNDPFSFYNFIEIKIRGAGEKAIKPAMVEAFPAKKLI